jgi:hypothetical protein
MDTNRIVVDTGRVELLQAIPGRIRLRVPEIKGNPAKAREVEQQVGSLAAVRRIEVSPITGSVLVIYDPDDAASIAEVGRLFLPSVDLATVATLPDSVSEVDAVTPSVVEGIMRNFRAINANVGAATGGLDLRVLLPVTLVLLGIKSLVSDRERSPGWYNYFWFAFGTFCTLNRRLTSENSAPAVAGMPAAGSGNGEAS